MFFDFRVHRVIDPNFQKKLVIWPSFDRLINVGNIPTESERQLIEDSLK